MREEQRHIDMDIEDALIEKPYCFSVGTEEKDEEYFYLFPTTLGKVNLIKRHMDNLQIRPEQLQVNPFLEILRVVEKNKEESCKIIAFHTFKKKRDIFDYKLVERRTSFFKENMTTQEVATLLFLILTKNDLEVFKKHLGIAKEQERLRAVVEAKRRLKKSKEDYAFGGKSIYGTLIDAACERYGWTYDYVMWGISLTNLQLIMADRVQTIFLTDDERKKIPSRLLNSEDTINADDKTNQEKILSMDWR